MFRWLVLALLIPMSAFAQDFEIRSGGKNPPDPEVLALIRSYTPHLMSWTSIDDRDARRRPMVAKSYFYHDLNGSDIDFDGLTARHKKNDLRISDCRFFDVILYQEENSAILSYKSWQRGSDKGHPFEGTGSAAIVMSRTADGWRVAADIMGQDPPTEALVPREPPGPPPGVQFDPEAGEIDPTSRLMHPPIYPTEERQRGVTGNVSLDLVYDAAGKITSVEVKTSSGNSNLDKAAIKAAKEWKVVPGMRAGVRIAGRVEADVAFKQH